MTNIRARNLFTAILVARAICGIGAAQADWASVDKTPGPGHIVTGTGACLGLAGYLDVNYNDVTLQDGATSSETLPFRVSDMSNPTADILGNTLVVGGSVTTAYADGVDFMGYRVNGNSVTVDPSGSITSSISLSSEVTGIYLDGWTEVSDNTVTNHGSISAFDYGIGLDAGDTLTDNIVFNDGQITGGGVGIHLEGNHISGAGVTDLSGNLADSVTNSGAISVAETGIHLEAGEDITDVRITNTSGGTISSKSGVGISLSAEGEISGSEVYNAGSIEGKYAGVLLGANHVSDNVVANSGNIAGGLGGILVRFDGSAENNALTNSGTIQAEAFGIGILGAGDATGNQLANTVDGLVYAEIGLGIDTSGNATFNELTNDGQIFATSSGMEISAFEGALHNTLTNNGSIDVSGNDDGDLTGIAVSAAYGDVAGNQVTNAYNVDDPVNLTVSASASSDEERTASGIVLRSYTGEIYGNTVENDGSLQVTATVDVSGGDPFSLEAAANGIVLSSYEGNVGVDPSGGAGGNVVTSYDISVAATTHAAVYNAYGFEDFSVTGEALADGIAIYSGSGDVANNSVSSGYVHADAAADTHADYSEVVYGSFSMANEAGARGITLHSEGGDVTGNSVSSLMIDANAAANASVYVAKIIPYEDENVAFRIQNSAAASGIEIFSSTGAVTGNKVTSSTIHAHALADLSASYMDGGPITLDNEATSSGIDVHGMTGVSGNIIASTYLETTATADANASYTHGDSVDLNNMAAADGIALASMSGDVSGNSVTSTSLSSVATAHASALDLSGESIDIDGEATSKGITFGSSLGDVAGNQATNLGNIESTAQTDATIGMDTSGGYPHFNVENDATSNGIELFSMAGEVSGNQVANQGTLQATAGATSVANVLDPSGGSIYLDNEVAANGLVLYSYAGDVLGNIVNNIEGEGPGSILATANSTANVTVAGGSSVNVGLDSEVTANGLALLSYIGTVSGNHVTSDLDITALATSTLTDTSGTSVQISMDSEANAAGILILGAAGCGETDGGNTVTNSGAITASATAAASTTDLSGNLDSRADAVGIGLRSQFGEVAGNVVGNTGAISVLAQATTTATDSSGSTINSEVIARAAGIELGSYAGDLIGNQVTNSGTITVHALAGQTYTSGETTAQADGIYLHSGVDDFVLTGPGPAGGKLTDNVVTLASTSIISSSGDGVHLRGDDTLSGNSVTNAGAIYAENYGILVESQGDDVSGNTVVNAAGGFIMAGHSDGISLDADLAVRGNTVTNSGTITLPDGHDGIELYSYGGDVVGNTVSNTASGVIDVPEGGNGISLDTGFTLSGNIVSNAGEINALSMSQADLQEVSPASDVIGIELDGYHYVQGNKVTNLAGGTITLGDESVGISLTSDGDVSGNEVRNFGGISAGDFSQGILLASDDYNVLGNTVENANGASITAGDRSVGILIAGRGDADDNLVTNAGSITVGNLGTDVSGNIWAGGIVITGAEVYGKTASDTSYNTVSGNTVNNLGDITVKTDMWFGELHAGGIVIGSLGELGNFGKGAVTEPTSSVTGNTVTNSGTITVVTSEDSSGNVLAGGIMIGNAYENLIDQVQGYPAISGNTVTNTATGQIEMGEDGVGILIENMALGYDNYGPEPVLLENGSPIYGTFGNTVVNAGHIDTGANGVGIKFLDEYCVTDNTITNSGDITSGDYGYGVMLDGHRSLTLASTGNTVTNTGSISVGDWGEGVALWDIDDSTVTNLGTIEAGVEGYGVDIQGNGNELTNWGRIRVDAPLILDADLPDAIYVSGNGNVVNLEGHSSLGNTGETGKITGVMSDISGNANILNVNFTGLSPEVMADLEDTIASQVDSSGNPLGETVTFTVRGVTYVVDPMQIHVDLSSYQEQAQTPNQGSIGANLDSLTENPDPGTDFFNLLNAVDMSGDVPASLGFLSPQGYQLYGNIAVSTMSGVSQQIDHRMAFLNEDMPEKRGNLWISGGYKSATVDAGDHDSTKAEFDTNSVVVGADYRVSPNFTIGALFHYSTTNDAKLDTKGSRADVDSHGFGVYAGYRQGGIYGNALFVHSRNDYKSTRTVPIPDYSYTAKAETNGHQTGFALDGGYDFQINDQLVVGPLAGLQYVHLSVDGFRETGAYGANLAVESQTMKSLLGRVGGRLAYNATVNGNNTFSLDVHAALQHEFKDDSRNITASFISAGDLLGAFSVKTTDPKRNSVLFGAGFNYDFHGAVSIFANYDMQAGSSNWHEHNVKGGVKISF